MARWASQPACRCPYRRHGHDLDFGRRLSGNHWRLAGAARQPGGYRFIVDHKTHDRLTALRGPGESYNEAAAQRQPSWRNRLALFGCRVAL